MPDEILHHILTFIPTELAITTSVLSRRWRHIWCETPCLYINECRKIKSPQTLKSYMAPKIEIFNLRIFHDYTALQIDSWIDFAMSRNVQKLSLAFGISQESYSLPDIIYLSSSLKQLKLLNVSFNNMLPRCTVSWKSLKNLSLRFCKLGDESIAKILSGSPKLESLTLCSCDLLERLDLTKSLSLRTLDIFRSGRYSGPAEIIAPHIHYLRLRNSYQTLTNVSSLTEADIDIGKNVHFSLTTDFILSNVLKMLESLKNVKRLTLRRIVLQFLSLAELHGVPFPTLNAQTLIVKTLVVQSVIPGIARLLQNSPELKKLIVHATNSDSLRDMDIANYLNSKGLNPDRCWTSEYKVFPTSQERHFLTVTPKLLASFVVFALRKTKTLETVVVWLFKPCSSEDAKLFEELPRMARTLSHNNNVSVVIKRSNEN